MTDDLAGEFQRVDAASDFAVFSNCLTLIDSLPFFAECKRESYDLLGATPGSRILEVGCGLGEDAVLLARLVAPGGSVVAIDGSQTMITAACERHGVSRACRSTLPTPLSCRSTMRVSMPAGSIGCFSTSPIPLRQSVRWSA